MLDENELALRPLIDQPTKRDKYFDDNGADSDNASDDYRLVERGIRELREGLNLRLHQQPNVSAVSAMTAPIRALVPSSFKRNASAASIAYPLLTIRLHLAYWLTARNLLRNYITSDCGGRGRVDVMTAFGATLSLPGVPAKVS